MRRIHDARKQQTDLANHETDYKTAKTVVAFKKKSRDACKNRSLEREIWLTDYAGFYAKRGGWKGPFFASFEYWILCQLNRAAWICINII